MSEALYCSTEKPFLNFGDEYMTSNDENNAEK